MSENENVLPEGDATGPLTSNYGSAKLFSSDKRDDAIVAFNGKLAPPLQKPLALPKLIESTQTGYKAGVAKQVLCCTVGPHLIEKNAAYDYILMANAAAQDGITLSITEAFRKNERQEQLYNARRNPAVAAEKGVAAKPGFSNHQTGIAVDINVKMSVAMYKAGNFTAEYKWLEAHAAQFGFDHKEGASVNEPWHWTHLESKISGSTAFRTSETFASLTSDTAVGAASLNQSGTLRSTSQEAHDVTVGLVRGYLMPGASRATLQAAHSLFCANQSNGHGSQIAQWEAGTLETEPTSFDTSTLGSFSYDFATGTWGDGETV
jgi:hypothetical protein